MLVTLGTLMVIDCKTVGFFFLKISEKIGKAWRQSLALCFQPRSRPFV